VLVFTYSALYAGSRYRRVRYALSTYIIIKATDVCSVPIRYSVSDLLTEIVRN
jgi:hypothetical protein